MPKKSIYFAHPIKSYHTTMEAEILRVIGDRFPGYRIINPADMRVSGGFVNCKDCMNRHMRPKFFKKVAEANIFVVWGERDSCGIRCELHKAWELNKEVYEVRQTVNVVPITLQEYHYHNR